MQKIKNITESAISAAVLLFGLVTLCILGSEPATFDEAGIDLYEASFEKWGFGWWMGRVWVGLIVFIFISLAVREMVSDESNA